MYKFSFTFLGVPLHLFFLSVFVGLMPYNYICVTSGAILNDIQDISDIMTWTNLGNEMIEFNDAGILHRFSRPLPPSLFNLI